MLLYFFTEGSLSVKSNSGRGRGERKSSFKHPTLVYTAAQAVVNITERSTKEITTICLDVNFWGAEISWPHLLITIVLKLNISINVCKSHVSYTTNDKYSQGSWQ